MNIVEGKVYTSKKNPEMKALVTSIVKDPVMKDVEIEYFLLNNRFFCSTNTFLEVFEDEEANTQ